MLTLIDTPCSRCGSYERYESIKRRTSRPGGTGQCAECRRRATKAYKARYPERARESRRRSIARAIANNPELYYRRCQEQQCKWRENNPERFRSIARKASWKQYGIEITEEDYNTLLQKQQGVCAICSNPSKHKRLHVDHCHETKVVRGLLCFRCNTLLGAYEALAEPLQRYLAQVPPTG